MENSMFNKNLYPTPDRIIKKMIEKIDLKNVKYVLEPSAGKGDLVQGINQKINNFQNQNHYRYTTSSGTSYANIDLIEIDPNLRSILKDKKYNVVYDDFLSFYTQKSYDLIIANPPFDSGHKHLLKMIELGKKSMKSCQIVCLINAETVKNLYNIERQELAKQLEKLNADVEFIENGFNDAERKTNVEIALVYIKIEKKSNFENSYIFDDLKRSNEALKNNDTKYKNQIVSGDILEKMVQQYNFEIVTGLKLINEYNNITQIFEGKTKFNNFLELSFSDNPNGYIGKVREFYWKKLFNNEQFMELFTNNLRNEYVSKIDELTQFDFNLYNIYTIKIELNKHMISAMEDTIINMFDEFTDKYSYREYKDNRWLYNGWKTNNSFKVNDKKIILPFQAWDGIKYSWEKFKPTHWNFLDVLKNYEKALSYLAANEKTIDLEKTLKKAEETGQTKKIECEYWFLTCYKKGTIHIEWKDVGLIKKLNIFAGKKKNWLFDGFGQSEFNNLNSEQKQNVKEFLGKSNEADSKKGYNEIYQNKNYYLSMFETLKLIS